MNTPTAPSRVFVVVDSKGFLVGVYSNYHAAAAAVNAHPYFARISHEPVLSK